MLNCNKRLHRLALVIMTGWVMLMSTSAMAQNSPNISNKTDTRIYLARDESTRRVMETLLAMLGKRLVTDSVPNRPVNGRFEVKTVDDVMAYFQSAYQINHFVSGNNVYVYAANDWKTSRLYVGQDKSNEDWKETFNAAGLYYKDFPFVANRESKELVVSGPRAYIKLIETAFSKEPPSPSEIEKHGVQLMVFPLKHASVEDRVTNLRGASVSTPGALTVLLNLLGLPAQNQATKPISPSQGGLGASSSALANAPIFNSSERLASLPVPESSSIASKQGSEEQKKKDTPLSVTADPRTNSILIRDAGTRYDYYKSLIDQLDKPVAMIEVEAMLVEVDQQVLNELGLEFGLRSGSVTYDFPGSSVGRPSLLGPGATSIVDPGRFIARLRALAADENAKVLARPTIVTQDNVSAYIDLSQTIFLSLTGERVADVRPITAGSLLQVTPRVVMEESEEKIFLRVEIQDGSLSDNSGIGLPRVQNTALSTQALIQREKAILIGGYNRESAQTREYKVPLLGDIPWVGKAFSSVETKNQTLARLFLITPKLVEPPTHHGASTRKAANTIEQNFSIREESLQPTQSLKLEPSLRLIMP